MANTVAAQLLIDGVYTTKKAFIAQEITATIGPDPSSGTQPSEVSLTWDNFDLSMDPSNPLGPLYHKIGRQTPFQLVVDGAQLAAAESSEWVVDRTIDHVPTAPLKGVSTVAYKAMGILDRIKNQWKEPLRSPMYTEIVKYPTLLGYWTGEGGAGGSTLQNETAGPAGVASGSVTWGGDPGPSGSAELIQLGSDGALSGRFLRASGNGYQVCWSMRIPATLTATNLTIFSFTTTDGVRFEWQISSTQFTFNVIANDGTLLSNLGSIFGGVSPNSFMRARVKVTFAAGLVTVEPAWYAQDASSILGVTMPTYAFGGTGRPQTWAVLSNAYTSGASYGHVFAVTDTTLDLAGGYNPTQVFNGYKGERAFDRWSRLLTGVGISAFIIGSNTDTMPMGPQKPGLLFDLLDECVITEGGLQWDTTGSLGVTFRTRMARYGQTSKMDLTYGVDVAPPLLKQIGPVGVANRMTVNNSSGTSATVAKTSGSMSTANPPAGIGEVRGQVDVNMANDGLIDDRAGWELRLGTLDRPRYLQVTVDLLANPGYKTAVAGLRPGDTITLAGVEPDPVLLQVIQFTHQIGHTTRTVSMKCVPGEQWNSGVYGTARYTVRSSSVNTAMTTTSTSLAVLLTDSLDRWSTTATGYDLVLNSGERVRVTGAFSAPVANVQTATVTRSINGVVSTHAVGDSVELYRAARYVYNEEGSGGLTMVAGGDVIAAGDINRLYPNVITATASSALPASSSGAAVPGISIAFTTATAGAKLSLWWTIRADPTGAATTLISARPHVVGPSAFAQDTNNFALAQWNAGAVNDVMTASNADQITLGAAGAYTVTLLGTTGANEQIGIYSSVTVMVQETGP
jgi:hypothetical protein